MARGYACRRLCIAPELDGVKAASIARNSRTTLERQQRNTGFGGTSLTYNANGNLTSDGTNTYPWDARNHLTATSGAARASFIYDAFGRRTSKTIGPMTTQFPYAAGSNAGNPERSSKR
jgi:YD repeat-containing protein